MPATNKRAHPTIIIKAIDTIFEGGYFNEHVDRLMAGTGKSRSGFNPVRTPPDLRLSGRGQRERENVERNLH